MARPHPSVPPVRLRFVAAAASAWEERGRPRVTPPHRPPIGEALKRVDWSTDDKTVGRAAVSTEDSPSFDAARVAPAHLGGWFRRGSLVLLALLTTACAGQSDAPSATADTAPVGSPPLSDGDHSLCSDFEAIGPGGLLEARSLLDERGTQASSEAISKNSAHLVQAIDWYLEAPVDSVEERAALEQIFVETVELGDSCEEEGWTSG